MTQFREDRPIYQQIVEWVIRETIRGTWREGDRLPAIRTLAQDLRVNPNTVARAIQELERMGWVETRRGEGTYIRASREDIAKKQEAILRDLAREVREVLRDLGLADEGIRMFCRMLEKEALHDGD